MGRLLHGRFWGATGGKRSSNLPLDNGNMRRNSLRFDAIPGTAASSGSRRSAFGIAHRLRS